MVGVVISNVNKIWIPELLVLKGGSDSDSLIYVPWGSAPGNRFKQGAMCLRWSFATRLPNSRGYSADFFKSLPPVLWSRDIWKQGNQRLIENHSNRNCHHWSMFQLKLDKLHLLFSRGTGRQFHHPFATFTESLPLCLGYLPLELLPPNPEQAAKKI